MELNLKKLDLQFGEKQHAYLLNGSPVVGVTTITDLMPKKALVPWAAKITSEDIQNNWLPDQKYSKELIDKICKDGKMAWRNSRDKSADKGTEAHGLIERWIKEKVFPESKDKDVQNCIRKFLEWEASNKVEWVANELRVASEHHKYAGTLDAIAIVNGKPYLVDFKTSSGIYVSAYIQTAGYAHAVFEMGGPEMDRMILWIPKKGDNFEARVVPTPYKQDEQMFLNLLAVAQMLYLYEV